MTHDELEALTGTSTHAYGTGASLAHQVNRAQRRAMEAEKRRLQRQFKRQLRHITKGSVFDEAPE